MFFSTNAPISVRVNSTKETITRVPLQRSGYAVVRYNGNYYPLFGGPNVQPYITGRSVDAMGQT